MRYKTEDLLSRTRREGDCLVWTGPLRAGYGAVERKYAHRLMYELTHGVTLERHQHVCHSCDNPPCINPAHLWVGSARDNARDRDAKQRSAHPRIFTDAQVREIRLRYASKGQGIESNATALALEYGVTKSCIFNIVRRHRYADVA